jgi:hypothetical protein
MLVPVVFQFPLVFSDSRPATENAFDQKMLSLLGQVVYAAIPWEAFGEDWAVWDVVLKSFVKLGLSLPVENLMCFIQNVCMEWVQSMQVVRVDLMPRGCGLGQ